MNRRRPSGLPSEIVLLATPDGWRHTVRTLEGGTLCGRLRSEQLDPEAALAAATEMLKALAWDVHGTTVEVTWDPHGEPGTSAWTGRVVAVPGGVTARADSGS